MVEVAKKAYAAVNDIRYISVYVNKDAPRISRMRVACKKARATEKRSCGREKEFSDVRANGGRSSCNEIQPHWIHGVVSGVERPSFLKFLGGLRKRKRSLDN